MIASTLLSFAPGELSTYGGPLIDILHAEVFTPTAYNFADLPCPPQSIMYDQWYKPEPGHPFRPILAFPSKKVLDIDPAWASCAANLFTGIDPPRALGSTNAMAVPVKTHDAFAPHTTSVSVPTPTLETQYQPASALKQPKSQMMAPQETAPPPGSITKDDSFTTTSPATSGNEAAYPQMANEVPAPAAQSFASVGGYPIVALPLQRASRTLEQSSSATASDPSNLAVESSDDDDPPNPNDGPAADEALAKGSSQTSDISTIQKTPAVDTSPAASHNSDATVGTTSSSGDSGYGRVSDDSQNTNPSGDKQSSKQKQWNSRLPGQSDDLKPQVYQVGPSQITAGGPTLTISGTVVFAPTSGDCVVVGGQTFQPSHLSDDSFISTPITDGAQPTSIGEQQPVTFYSHNTDHAPNSQANSLALPTTNITGKTFIPLPSDAGIAVDDTTLSPGDKTTGNGGQVVSNAGNGIVVVGSQTVKLSIPSAGTGARNDTSTTAGAYFLPFEGRASRDRGMLCWHWVWSFAAIFLGLVRL